MRPFTFLSEISLKESYKVDSPPVVMNATEKSNASQVLISLTREECTFIPWMELL